MNLLKFQEHISNGNVIYVKYGRGAVLIALDFKDKDVYVQSLVEKEHGFGNLDEFRMVKVNALTLDDDHITVELAYAQGLDDALTVTKILPKSQVGFEAYI